MLGTGLGIVRENVNFRSSETDFPQRKKKIHGREKNWQYKKKEAPVLVLH